MIELLIALITPSTILIFLAALLVTYYVTTMPRSLNMPPGPFPLPVIGNFVELQKKPDPGHIFSMQSLSKKYGKIFTLKLGSIYTVVISDYKLLIEAFVKKSDVFTDRLVEQFYVLDFVNSNVGAGVVTSNGHTWKNLRRTAFTTMRGSGVGKRSLEEKIQEEITVLLDVFSQQRGVPFNAKPLFNVATSNVICQVMFGSRFEYDDEKFKEMLRVLDDSLKIDPVLQPVNFFPFLKHFSFFKKVAYTYTRALLQTIDFIQSLTASDESTFDPDNIRDFVDQFIKLRREQKDDKTYDSRCMSRVIVDLFAAGSDTTANTLSWGMLYMAKYPHIQQKCQQQIDEVIGKGKLPSLADREKLPYVEASILEILRLRPPAPTGVPHSTSKDVEFHGYNIPKNTLVIANLMDINMDPETFPYPNEFDPRHFLNEDGQITHRESMVSFSVGPRSCVGEILAKMELSLIFTAILQFFTISPEMGKPIDLSATLGFILNHQEQNVVLRRRD